MCSVCAPLRAARKRRAKTGCSLSPERDAGNAMFFVSIDRRLPKLDVAGSNPVSRSKFFNNLQAFRQSVGSNWLHLVYGEGFL